MAERDKVIKSGQITLPRILFLALVGGIIVFTVYAGGVYLSIGYWFLTLAISGLLFLIAIDYGVKMDRVDLSVQPVQAAAAAESTSAAMPSLKTSAPEARPKRRSGSRPAKRRR
ncbi:MAG: hypothetical protein AABN33_13100 [Acidobacteriota bacterium]